MSIVFLSRTMWVALVIAAGAAAAPAGEWPRFLGPHGTGVVEKGEKIARTWPQGGPRELWRVSVGSGFGGAAIADGKVFLLDRNREQQDIFRVLDLKTGAPIWEHRYDASGFKGGFPGSRGTPSVEGNRVYTVGVMGHVHCFDIGQKKALWSKSLRPDFGAEAGDWGFAQSPLIVGDSIVLSIAGGPNGLVALDKNTGQERWKTDEFGRTDTYTSPMSVKVADVEQVVMWHRGELAAFDPASGKKLWSHAWRTNRPIPQPVFLGDGRFFLTIGYGGGCAMIHVQKTGDTWSVKDLFQDDRSGSKVPPALFYQGHIYTNSDDNKRGLQCLDANGEVKWETGRKTEFGLGSMIIADGVIFIVNGDTGDLVMAEASPKGYKELGRAKVLGGRDIWAPLALSDGRLVVRDQSQMKCLYVGADNAGGG